MTSSNDSGRSRAASLDAPSVLIALVLLGLLLRIVLVLVAENRLDSDEAVVGAMALDVLEGKAFPLFFGSTALNQNVYNGGAAHEAYLGAVCFALLGPSATVLKLAMLAFWSAAALLFADLCRRELAGGAAFLAVLFFCAGTPFLLEWSVKARGGYAGTVLFSVLLLWLAAPPPFLRGRLRLRCASFGVVTGIGLWSSEMIVPMLPCALAWLLWRCERAERGRALSALAVGAAVGLLPLLGYNALNDWEHLRSSVLYSFLQPRDGTPLGPGHLLLSARFVLGPGWPLAVAGFLVAGWRLAVQARRPGLGQVVLVQGILYLVGYWYAGLRYLELPPSRVLYSLYPAFALLLALAVSWPGVARGGRRWLAAGLVLLWLGTVAVPVARWASAGVPRETGSWRGSWSLTDGRGLHRVLREQGVDVAYVSDPTSRALAFASRVAAREDPAAPVMHVSHTLPLRRPPPGDNVAFALRPDSVHYKWLVRLLGSQRTPHERVEWGDFVVFAGIDPSRIRVWIEQGLPRYLGWPDLTVAAGDGFN